MWHNLPGVVNHQKRYISRNIVLRKTEHHENILCLENTMFRVYRVIHKSVKHFKNSQQIDDATDHGNSYVDRQRNCLSFF